MTAQVSKALTRKYPFLGDYVSVICVCLCVRLLTVMHTTVDREIFTVKKFPPVTWVAKIKRVKNSFVLYIPTM